MEMQGRVDEGARSASREADWAPDNVVRVPQLVASRPVPHGCRPATTSARLYDAHVHPKPAQYVLTLVDATALLWRLDLEGVDVGERFEAWPANGRRVQRGHGFYAFNDFTRCSHSWPRGDDAHSAAWLRRPDAARATAPTE